jgi:hypothetical protein
MALLPTVRVLSCKYSPPPDVMAVLPLTDAPSRRLTADEEIAHEPPPFPPALLPSMALPDTVRVLVCKHSPPPLDAAMLPLKDASSIMSTDEEIAYEPPPSSPALLPSMALPDTVRVLSCKYSPPPLDAAVLPLTAAP